MNTSRAHAEARRDAGIEQSSSHAERKNEGWNELALALLRVYCHRNRSAEFTGEEAREKLDPEGLLPDPPDGRAWGAVFQRAAREGIIAKTGQYRVAKSSNLSPKPVWIAK